MKEVDIIFLTDITLHLKDFRQTVNYSKVAEKGRMYSPVHKEKLKRNPVDKENYTMKIQFTFPQDLQEKIDKGEAIVMMSDDGLNVYPGKDVVEKMAQMQAKKRRQNMRLLTKYFYFIDSLDARGSLGTYLIAPSSGHIQKSQLDCYQKGIGVF